MTGWRVVQRGRGPLVACYLVGDQCDPELRAALPGAPIVATVEAPLQPVRSDLDRARGPAGADSRTVLVGFSGGCQPVRAHLMGGVDPEAVVCLDGTHDTIPPSHLDVWRQLAAEARRGERVFVGTCTQMSYVERIPVGQKGRATSTRHVLEAAIGEQLPPLAEVHEGGLHVLSFPSGDIDEAAHKAQQRVTMPDVLRRFVAPLFADAQPDTERAPRPPATDVALAVLAEAEADLTLGIREHGHNDGPEIRRLYLDPMSLAPGSNYCAAAVASWLRRARDRGVDVPILGSASAKNTRDQLAAEELWTPAAHLRAEDLAPGMLVVWDRAIPGRPETAWHGHIGIVVDVGREVFWTIEANADRPLPCDAVAMLERRLDDARLLGAGRLSAAPALAA